MFKIAIVIFRECLEIAILLGIILAVTSGIKNSRTYVILGSIIGIAGASLLAFFARNISVAFSGLGDEIFNVIIIFMTVIVICWTVFWMKGEARRMKDSLGELTDKITEGTASLYMLALVVATTIFREGTEVILFVYSIASSENLDVDNYIIGLGVGAALGLLVGSSIYIGLVKLAGSYIFKLSSFLLTIIAAGLSAQAAGLLNSTGMVIFLSDEVWDSSWFVADNSIAGKCINVLTGYIARPTGLQILAYLATIVLILALVKIKSVSNSEEVRD